MRVKVKNTSIVIYGKKSFNNGNTLFRNNHDFEKTTGDNNSIELGINELNKIGNSKIDGKYIPEILSYDSISLWWFCYNPLTDNFIKTLSFIENFINFVEETNPSKIKVKNDFSKLDLIKQICINYKIPISYSRFSYSIFIIKDKLRQIIKQQGAKYITRKKIRSRLKLYSQKFTSIPSTENKIVFVSYPIYRRPLYDLDKKISVTGEFLIDELLKLFQDKKAIIGLDLFSFITSDERVLKERLESEMFWIPVEKIMEKITDNSSHQIFIKNFENLLKSNFFEKLFEYRGVNYWNYLSFRFKEMTFEYYFPFWLRLLDAVRNYFSENKPKVVFLLYETRPTSLAIISACKTLGIKTIGIQHGIIHSHHTFYMHDQFMSEKHQYGFQLPDKLLLFGDIPKQVLLERGYPEDRLIAFGNPMFFHLDKIKPKNNLEEFVKKYQLPSNCYFVLFAPPAMRIYKKARTNFNKETLEKLLEIANKRNDFIIIIKPHPDDNPQDYQSIIDQKGSDNAKVLQGDLIELILNSDIVISTVSTSIIDAMCMNKPVIQVKFEEVEMKQPYDEYEAVLESKLNNLKENIQKIINDKDLCQKLLEQEHKFVKKYYNISEENPRNIINKILS